MTNQKFLSKILLELIKSKIAVVFQPDLIPFFVEDENDHEDFCNGLYDGESIQVSTKGGFKNWFEIFLHEYCHFLQDKTNYKSIPGATSDFESWCYKDLTLSKRKLNEICKDVQNCEHDADKRVIELVEKYNLKIDKDLFIMKSNSYVFSYEMRKRHRMENIIPYMEEKIYSLYKPSWYDDYSKLPKTIEKKILDIIK